MINLYPHNGHDGSSTLPCLNKIITFILGHAYIILYNVIYRICILLNSLVFVTEVKLRCLFS